MLTLKDFLPAGVADLSVLTPVALRALRGLVYGSKEYRANIGYYGDVYAVIKDTITAGKLAYLVDEGTRTAEQIEQVATAQTLAAVVFKLDTFPALATESEGSDKRRTFFSTTVNWEELAKDVLDTLFQPVGEAGSSSNTYIVVDRNMFDCSNQAYPDEMFLTTRYRGTVYVRSNFASWGM
jgi:hypothetical protein